MYALCVSGDADTQGLVWQFCMCHIYIDSLPSFKPSVPFRSQHINSVCTLTAFTDSFSGGAFY